VLPHGSSGPPSRRRRRPGAPDSPTRMFSAARPLAHSDGRRSHVGSHLGSPGPCGAAPVVVRAPCRTRAQPGNVAFRPEAEPGRMAGWTVCTTSAGCTGSERSRSRPTNRSSTSRGKVGSGRCSVRWRPPPTGAASGAQANRYAEQDATTLVTDPADGRAGTASAERGARGATRCSTAPSPGGTDRPELGGGAGPAAGDEGRVAQALDGCPSARIVGAALGRASGRRVLQTMPARRSGTTVRRAGSRLAT